MTIWLTLLGMALATYATRSITMLALRGDVAPWLRRWVRDGYGWLDADRGRRAPGLGYLGTPSGGVAFGIRNFWQSHPAQLDIRHATGDTADVTLWMWAPCSPPMDLRFYHDGMGQVVAVRGQAETAEAEVYFGPDVGTKRLLLRYAPLVKL